jgi:CHAT domain-containing protein
MADPDYELGGERDQTEERASARGQGPTTRWSAALAELRFEDLPGTRLEGQTVAEILQQRMGLRARLYLGPQALEQTLSRVKAPRVVHLSTHGYFLPDERESRARLQESWGAAFPAATWEQPLARSGVVLAGANAAIRQGRDEGIVSAEKVLGLQLHGTELVVLSGCETGLGDVRRGEGVFGLQRAFILAGARTLVMSLWRVSDQAAQALMSEFYRQWADGKSKVEALRQARLTLRRRQPHPWAWAAFVLIGDPR